MWIEFYYHFGRFPGSDHFANVPHAEIPYFLKTTMPLSPVKLHTSFRGTDVKGLAFLHALAALKFISVEVKMCQKLHQVNT